MVLLRVIEAPDSAASATHSDISDLGSSGALPVQGDGFETHYLRVGYFVLELLQATLFDPATVEAAQAMATVIQSHSKET